jgi:hypothetical protein
VVTSPWHKKRASPQCAARLFCRIIRSVLFINGTLASLSGWIKRLEQWKVSAQYHRTPIRSRKFCPACREEYKQTGDTFINSGFADAFNGTHKNCWNIAYFFTKVLHIQAE